MSQNQSELSVLGTYEEESMLDAINSITSENDFEYLQKCVSSLENKNADLNSTSNLHLENLESVFKNTDDFHNVDVRFMKEKNMFLGSKINEYFSHKKKFLSKEFGEEEEEEEEEEEVEEQKEQEQVPNLENDSESSNGILDYVVNSENMNYHLLDSSPIVHNFENFENSKFLDPIEESVDNTADLEEYNIDSPNKNCSINKKYPNSESSLKEKKIENESSLKDLETETNKNDNLSSKLKVCTQCPMTFKYKRHLDRHMEGHEKNNCSHCNAKFARRKHLDIHLFRIHGERSSNRHPYSCDVCFSNFPKKILLNRHRAKHFENAQICPECGIMMESDEDIQKHKLKHEKEKHFTCARCSQTFSTEQTYQNHIQNHDNYKCPNCDASFASKKTASKHFRLNHSTKSQNIKPIKDGLYFCADCHQGFVKKSGYCRHLETAMHLNKVNQDAPLKALFSCPVCKKALATRPACVQHIRRVHRGEKKFLCDTEGCSFQCAYKNDLDRHKQLHVEERNIICEHCGKTFTSVSILKDHILYIHNKERQFVCEECGKSFKRNSLLNRHKLSHQQLRPFACKQCSAAFKRSHHLSRHMESCHRLTLEKKRKVVKLMKTENGDLVPVPDQNQKSKKANVQKELEVGNKSEMENKIEMEKKLEMEKQLEVEKQLEMEKQLEVEKQLEMENKLEMEKQLEMENKLEVSLIEKLHNSEISIETANSSTSFLNTENLNLSASEQEVLPIDNIVNQFESSCHEMNDILNRDQSFYANHSSFSELQMENVQENFLNSNDGKDPIDNYLSQTFPSFLNL